MHWRVLTIVAVMSVAVCDRPLVLAAAADPEGKVEVIRDRWGIPHVFAETDAGAMYGLGYAAAEERSFQMYYNLRIIQGRLAEILGNRPAGGKDSPVEHDRKMRTFGFYRAAKVVAERLDADTRAMLAAYSGGVNRYIEEHRDALHPMFEIMDLQPEPWTPADCIASWWHLGQFFATDGTRELIQYRNRQQPPAAAVARGGRGAMAPPKPLPTWYDDEAAVVQRADVSDEWLDRVNAFSRQAGSPDSAARSAGPRFSHAWVVGKAKTSTGSAVLVSDPQTTVWAPSLFHEFHVCGKTFNARGVGVPGSPALLIGFSRHFAWGATALGADQADLFRLTTDAEHPDQYLLDGQWRPMEVIRETIRVKDGRPVELAIRETVFGPVVTPFAFAAPGDPEVALRRVPVCQTDRETIQAAIGMMRAQSLGDFTRAIAAWQFPSLNLVFGDREGNIGYWLLAAIPVRSPLDREAGTATTDGSTSESAWRSFVPHDLLPHVVNPGRGWIASANHRAIGSFYPVTLGLSTGSMGHTVRSWRLYERLSIRESFTPEEVLDIHFDCVNPARRQIVQTGLALRGQSDRPLSPEAAKALEGLEAWHAAGARSDLNQPGAALAGEIPTMFRFVTTPLAERYGGGESGLVRFLRNLEDRQARDPKSEITAEEAAFIDLCLSGAWRSAQAKFGADPAAWDETARRQVGQRRLENFGSLDGFGSLDLAHDVAMPALECVDGGTIRSQAAQSYTQFVPLDDVDRALSLLPPGHSDRPGDPRRTSTLETWAAGQLHPAPLSREAVERIVGSRIELELQGSHRGRM